MGRDLQTEVLTAALKNLKKELAAMGKSEKAFLARYRTARLHAFQLEFLAKFLRKSQRTNLEIFERLNVAAKELEDRLGGFNEIDELIHFCEAREIHLQDTRPAAEHFKKVLREKYEDLRKWMSAAGWEGELPAAEQTAELIGRLESLSDEELKNAAIKKMSKVLRELQEDVDSGAFSPRRTSGYALKEIEPKIHELRREVRKIPMYAGYLTGLFALTDKYSGPSKNATRALKYFAPLELTLLAKSDFAKLPKPALEKPLLIPRPFFLAVTRYVSELGYAKDWAQNLERLSEAGLTGKISFDQLDPSLKDVFGRPESLNAMTSRTIKEIKKTQIFRHMAEYFAAQASQEK